MPTGPGGRSETLSPGDGGAYGPSGKPILPMLAKSNATVTRKM